MTFRFRVASTVRVGLAGALLWSCSQGARAADCLVESASFAKAESRPLRLALMPPRMRVIGDSIGASPVVAEAPVLAATLVPEVHCALEALGYEVEAQPLSTQAAGQRPPRVSDRDVESAWESLRHLTRRACDPGETLERGDGVPPAIPLAKSLEADGLVFVQALTLVRRKALRAFVRAIETVAPEVEWPGTSDDLTWVEIALIDGQSGELLALTAEVIESRLERNPRRIAVEAVQRAVAVLPPRGESSSWGLELASTGSKGDDVPPRCLLSISTRRIEYERLLERAAGARHLGRQ